MLNTTIAFLGFCLLAGSEGMQWEDLTELTPEQLANIEVTGATHAPANLNELPQSIYVITRDDLEKSGITHLVEALRMVPGIHIGRISSSRWSTGIRGFGDSLSRSILVLIDGCSVYNPLFAGVYWENQDYPIDIIDRIEVILGPGGSVWGANAVNGVVNIITKPAAATQGGYAGVLAGNMERIRASVRYGGTLGKGHYRLWGNRFEEGAASYRNGFDGDDWNHQKLGLRTDQVFGNTDLTIQVGFYEGDLGQRYAVPNETATANAILVGDGEVRGNHLLTKWQARKGNLEYQVRLYRQFSQRTDLNFHQEHRTLDGEVALVSKNRFGTTTVGGSLRQIDYQTVGTPSIQLRPNDDQSRIRGLFLEQQSWGFNRKLLINLGFKVEDQQFTNWEWQPRIGASYFFKERFMVWGSVSRAIRAPSRLERDIDTYILSSGSGVLTRLQGNPNFRAETLDAFEFGGRFLFARQSINIALFQFDYDQLLSTQFGLPGIADTPYGQRVVVPVTFGNNQAATSKGAELFWSFWTRDAWKFNVSYSFLNLDAEDPPENAMQGNDNIEGFSPDHQFRISANVRPSKRFFAHASAAWVDRLEGRNIPSYWNASLHLGFHPGKRCRISVLGRNLIENQHSEYQSSIVIERQWAAKLHWRW